MGLPYLALLLTQWHLWSIFIFCIISFFFFFFTNSFLCPEVSTWQLLFSGHLRLHYKLGKPESTPQPLEVPLMTAAYPFQTEGKTGPLHTFTACCPQNGNQGLQAERKEQGTARVFWSRLNCMQHAAPYGVASGQLIEASLLLLASLLCTLTLFSPLLCKLSLTTLW